MAKRKDQMHHAPMAACVASALASEHFVDARANSQTFGDPSPFTREGTGGGRSHMKARGRRFAGRATLTDAVFTGVVPPGSETNARGMTGTLGIAAQVRPVSVR